MERGRKEDEEGEGREGKGGRGSNERMDWIVMQEKQWSEENVPKSESVTIRKTSCHSFTWVSEMILVSREFVINRLKMSV